MAQIILVGVIAIFVVAASAIPLMLMWRRERAYRRANPEWSAAWKRRPATQPPGSQPPV
jgi:hypothetical protein